MREAVSHQQRSASSVFLNVYDLTPDANAYAYWCGIGVYHAGLEVRSGC